MPIKRELEIETDCISAKINIEGLRKTINQGLIRYAPDREDVYPRDTLIIEEASKFLKPLVDEFLP